MPVINIQQAIRDGLAQEMRRDPSVFIIGEDVGETGGVFRVTQGIYQEFGEQRAIDTSISEMAIAGYALGASLAGLRPVAEIMYMDFFGCCLDQIVNQAAKVKYMFGGKAKVPLVIRTSVAGYLTAGAQHSQSLEAWVCHVPGLKVVWPSTPHDAKGLIAAAIRDDDPVIFIEPQSEYSRRGEVPEGELVIPIGKADIKREGEDLTIISWGPMVHRSLAAAERLAQEGVSAEVIDLRSLFPLDKEAIFNSVRKTHRVVVAHQATLRGGYGGELAAMIQEELFDYLDGPIQRVGALNTPVPFSPTLENYVLPGEDDVYAAAQKLVG